MDLMDLHDVAAIVRGAVEDAKVGVVPIGAGTHREVANPVADGCDEIRIPNGIVSYDPNDMTITAFAGTPIAELNRVLCGHRQEVSLDPRNDAATLGGVLACGLSGIRRLRLGPIRDTVLEVRLIDGRGTLVKGGGPVVKNVTGYDLPRLVVGSFGTLGVILQATLRCRPAPAQQQWFCSSETPSYLRRKLFRPSAVLWDGTSTSVLLEGYSDDIASESKSADLDGMLSSPPLFPNGANRGRISVDPRRLAALTQRLGGLDGVRFVAEFGVGTVHIAADEDLAFVAARAAAVAEGGWMLRECGGPPGFGGFGSNIANPALSERVRLAFDPLGKLSPGRMVDV